MRYFLRNAGDATVIASAESDAKAEARLADGWREVSYTVWRDWWRWRDLYRLWELRTEAAEATPKEQAVGDAPPKGFVRFQG